MRRALLVLAAVGPLLGGCADYLTRMDGITRFPWDTQAQQVAAQAVNPWPRNAYDVTWSTDGTRAENAYTALQNGTGAASTGPASSSPAAN